MFGRFVVDDMTHRVDIDAARGNVGGDQDFHLAVLERGERTLALCLALVAVDRGGGDALLAEGGGPPCPRHAWSG